MCSSCFCSKYRHRLPAPMDCMVGDDYHVRLYSQVECGIGDGHPFYLGFTSVLRRRWSPSSSRFKFQLAGNWGAVWLLSTMHRFLCLLQALLSFSRSTVLLTSVLKCFVFTGHFLFEVFFLSCSFSLKSKYMLLLCCCSQCDCSFFIRAARLAIHSMKDCHEIYSA